MRKIFILECEQCNGEYGTTTHKSVHTTKADALEMFEKVLDKEDLKGEDAINEWRLDSSNRNIEQFRTGNWGFVVWTITTLPLYGPIGIPEEYSDENLNLAAILKLTMLPDLTRDCQMLELVSYYDNPRMFLVMQGSMLALYFKWYYTPNFNQREDPKTEKWIRAFFDPIKIGWKVGQPLFKSKSTGQLRDAILAAEYVEEIYCYIGKEGPRTQARVVSKEELLATKYMLPPDDRVPENLWQDSDGEDE